MCMVFLMSTVLRDIFERFSCFLISVQRLTAALRNYQEKYPPPHTSSKVNTQHLYKCFSDVSVRLLFLDWRRLCFGIVVSTDGKLWDRNVE